MNKQKQIKNFWPMDFPEIYLLSLKSFIQRQKMYDIYWDYGKIDMTLLKCGELSTGIKKSIQGQL